jgi:hypothetical protein
MDMEATERLELPMIAPGQAQKELFHNEALHLLEAVVAGAVEELERNDPPPSPVAGTCYLVGANPTGDWSTHARHLAAFSGAGWRFVAPVVGLNVMVKNSGSTATYMPGGWEVGILRASQLVVEGEQVIGARAAAIADPAGGSLIDSEARIAVAGILSAMRQHGLIAPE